MKDVVRWKYATFTRMQKGWVVSDTDGIDMGEISDAPLLYDTSMVYTTDELACVVRFMRRLEKEGQ